MDGASLTSYPRQLHRIGDRFSARVHVAPTARREADSGLIERLKDAQRADPERHE